MNKFLILIAAFLLIFKTSNAQTEKGNQTLGVNLGFQFSNGKSTIIDPGNGSVYSTNTNTYHSFDIGPNYSYFIAGKLELGGSLQYSTSSSKSTATAQDPQSNNSRAFGGQMFLHKYLMYQNKIGLRAGPYAGYSYATLTTLGAQGTAISKNKNNDYFGGGDLALVYYPSKSLGVSLFLARLTYDHTDNSAGNAVSADNVHGHNNNLNFNFISNGTSVSVYYVFGNR
ncbi:MAG TPA: hypothetical protein VIM55_08890 [Mucilaginibacter sp.]